MKTRKEFEIYLNETIYDKEQQDYLTKRDVYTTKSIGSLLRKKDYIAFEVGFNEWKLRKQEEKQ